MTDTASPGGENRPEISTNGQVVSSNGLGGLFGLIRGAPRLDTNDAIGVARVAGTAVWRLAGALTRRGVGAAAEIARDVQSGEPASAIIDNQVEKVRSVAVHALGLDLGVGVAVPYLPNGGRAGLAKARNAIAPPDPSRTSRTARTSGRPVLGSAHLKAVGDGMIRMSAYAANQPHDEHPAFTAMLAALTPDEARILRFLAVAGPQPSLDVRSKTPFGVGSERLAGGMNMIADMAGCSYPDHDHHYLANLNRLGLVRFSQEPVVDFRRYSLIEAQPKVAEAMEKVKKATTVYRSIYLSLFGQQFCEACFDLDGYDAGGWASDDRGDKIIGKGTPTPKKKHHA